MANIVYCWMELNATHLFVGVTVLHGLCNLQLYNSTQNKD